jgi:hypothetical protein
LTKKIYSLKLGVLIYKILFFKFIIVFKICKYIYSNIYLLVKKEGKRLGNLKKNKTQHTHAHTSILKNYKKKKTLAQPAPRLWPWPFLSPLPPLV